MPNNNAPETVTTLPQAVEVVNPSPFHPRNLFDLFFRPRRFFTNLPLMQHDPYIFIAALLYGISAIVPQAIEMTFGAKGMGSASVVQWVSFFGAIPIFGILAASLIWFVGGWWYWLRIRWSGQSDVDGFLARQVFFYSSLVMILPSLLTSILSTFTTLLLPISPSSALMSLLTEIILPILLDLLVIVSFWGVFVSYIGIRTCFSTVKWKAMLWFAILPLIISIIYVWGLFD